MKPLQIDIADLNKFRETETILYAKCGVTGKELRITCYGNMQVWQNGELKYEGIQPYSVVEYFNLL